MLFTFRFIQSAFHSKYGQANVKALQNRFKIIFKHYDEALLLIKLAFPSTSVTRLVDVLEFGQVFKAFGNNYFAQISHILREFFVNESKSIIFLVKSFLGNFFDIWRFFSGHTAFYLIFFFTFLLDYWEKIFYWKKTDIRALKIIWYGSRAAKLFKSFVSQLSGAYPMKLFVNYLWIFGPK